MRVVYNSFDGRYSDSPRVLYETYRDQYPGEHVWLADPAHLHGFPAGVGVGLRATPAGAVELDEELAGLPVTGVTWVGAVAYCAWAGNRVGAACRLPTEAEWRYAAAGPRGLRWALGDDFDRRVLMHVRFVPLTGHSRLH